MALQNDAVVKMLPHVSMNPNKATDIAFVWLNQRPASDVVAILNSKGDWRDVKINGCSVRCYTIGKGGFQMKKEFSADLIARQRLLMEREQAQDIEKNIFTTNQQTGLAKRKPLYTGW